MNKKVIFDVSTVYYVNEDTCEVEEALCFIGKLANGDEIIIVSGPHFNACSQNFDREYFDDEQIYDDFENTNDMVYKNKEDAVKNAKWEIDCRIKALKQSEKRNNK